MPLESTLKAWLSERAVALPELHAFKTEDALLAADWGPAFVTITRLDAPIPWSELGGRCRTWPAEARRQLEQHEAHLLVTVSGDVDVIELNLALTWIVAAAAASTDAAGVYWGSGGVVLSVDEVLAETAKMSREQLPLDLWIDFDMQKEQDGSVSLFTTGMHALGHMDFEVHRSTMLPKTLRNRVWNAAHHVLDHGPILKDGDTFGLTAEERIRVRHRRATPGRSSQRSEVVICLEM
jgi:hypothetical protein